MTSATAIELLTAFRTSSGNVDIPNRLIRGQADRADLCAQRLRTRRAAILGDPVGTGKTGVALAAARLLVDEGLVTNVLISAPNELVRDQWVERSAVFLPGLVSVVGRRMPFGQRPFQARSRGSGSSMPKITDPQATLIVVDEAHRGLQNERNASYQELARAAAGCMVLYVTATPMQLSADGLQTMLRAGDSSVDLSAVKRYHVAWQRCQGAGGGDEAERLKAEAAAREPDARAALDRYLLPPFDRKAAGLPDVPPLSPTPVEPGTDWLTAYHVARIVPELLHAGKGDMFQRRLVSSSEAFWGGHAGSKLVDNETAEVQELVDELRERLGQLDDHPKVRATTDWVARKVEAGRKVLVFCVFKETQETLHRSIERSAGDLPVSAPTTGVDLRRVSEAFADPASGPSVLILTDRFSESIDLDGGHPCLVHHDLSWSPVRLDQRAGRVVRISSGFVAPMPEDVYVPVLAVETDRRLFETTDGRASLIDRVLAGGGEAGLEEILRDEDGAIAGPLDLLPREPVFAPS